MLHRLLGYTSFWVGILWGLSATMLIWQGLSGSAAVSQLPAKSRFVALAGMPEDSAWRILEWPLGNAPPVVPNQARLVPKNGDKLVGPSALDSFTVESAGNVSVVTVNQGIFQRESFRYRVQDGIIEAETYQTTPTLLKLLLWGVGCLMVGALLADWLVAVNIARADLTGWQTAVAPLQWHVDLYGTQAAVRGAMAAAGFLRHGEPAVPSRLLPVGATANVKLRRLPARYPLPPAMRRARWLTGLAFLSWLLSAILPPFNKAFLLLLPLGLILGVVSVVWWVRGARTLLPDGKPWSARPWRLVVSVQPHGRVARMWHLGFALFPALALWATAGMILLARGALDTMHTGWETAGASLATLFSLAAILWAVRQRQRQLPLPVAAGKALAAALAAFPPADESRRGPTRWLPTLPEAIITLAMMGGLAAITVPQYGNYMIQSFVGEAASDAAKVTLPLADYFAQHGQWPRAWSDLSPPSPAPVLTRRGVLVREGREGVVELHFPPDFPVSDLRNAVLPLVPEWAVDGKLYWSPCRGLGLPVKQRAGYCRR